MGFSLPLNKIVTYVIIAFALIFTVLWLIDPDGGVLSGLKEIVIEDLDAGFGVEEVLADEVSISAEHKKEIDSMSAAFKSMLRDELADNCFHHFSGFTSFDNQIEIIMVEVGEDVSVEIKGGPEAKQVNDRYTIEDMGLCVVQGDNGEDSNFYHRFLKDDTLDPILYQNEVPFDVTGPYFKEVSSLIISFDSPWLDVNKNRINFGEGYVDFDGDDWLFSPDNKNICFFPTTRGGNVCQAGTQTGGFIDNDCFEDKSGDLSSIVDERYKTTIPYRSQHGSLNSC